ncbi:transglycosylase family protein [Streptomyces sp. NPDC004065]|uniref:transglycosylase family protein n=1 Tax=Streptomyces sp. NPDC004065 TaxID=3364689 RepID=UPI00384B0163
MLSGNGRHRRPRQAPALLVAAGVTGSAIAIPLLGASGASAADGTTWDKVAECETGGSWSADNGNGYYGGLQLTLEDWEAYGGLDFAPSPDQASRSQQIAVAEKILADRGPGAWPTCGLLAGLGKDSGTADVDTGVGDNPSTSPGSSDKSQGSGSSKGSGSSNSSTVKDPGLSDSSSDDTGSSGSSANSTGSPDSSGSPDGSSAKPSPTASSPAGQDGSAAAGAPAQGDRAGGATTSPSVSPGTDKPDNSEQIVGSSALVDTGALGAGRHRGGSAEEDPEESLTAASSGRHASRDGDGAHTLSEDYYTVRSGDSLASIADSLAVEGGWRALYEANESAIGSDPNHISAGQTLDVPVQNTRN